MGFHLIHFIFILPLLFLLIYLLRGPVSKGAKFTWKKDEDPALASDASILVVWLMKLQFTLLSFFPRQFMPLLFPKPMTDFCFFQEDDDGIVDILDEEFDERVGFVALTIDDCFCRQNDQSKSMVREVLDVISNVKFRMKATFFTTLQYTGGWKDDLVKQILLESHELGNHCRFDKEYDTAPTEEFEKDLDATTNYIEKMIRAARKIEENEGRKRCVFQKDVRWFRAPSGKISAPMSCALKKRGLKHVMLDCYANDPHIPDASFVASTILRSVQKGSIIVLHMPERGFREWELEAIKKVLEGLEKKRLRSVTLSELMHVYRNGFHPKFERDDIHSSAVKAPSGRSSGKRTGINKGSRKSRSRSSSRGRVKRSYTIENDLRKDL